MDFGEVSEQLEMRAVTDGDAGDITVTLDQLDGKCITNLPVHAENPAEWVNLYAKYTAEKGIHDVYVKLKGPVSLNSIRIY